MKTFKTLITAGTLGFLAIVALPLSASAEVIVTEGTTARFEIAAVYNSQNRNARNRIVRVWYDTDGGTAAEGEDYKTAHSWAHRVIGGAGETLRIYVDTFSDDIVEGDETFNIRIRRIEVYNKGRRGMSSWIESPLSVWKFEGAKTAVIKDATPEPPDAGEYEQEKYGSGYTGEVWGE